MSKTTARRAALLATSSLGLAAIASLGLALAPTAAAAQTCDPDPAAVAATSADDSVVCDEALYPTGVTYDTNGDLTVTTTIDAAEWGGNGIQLTGTGPDSITFDTDLEIEGRGLVGALLDVSTESGAIDILVENVDADAHDAAGVTHAIRALSDTGDITILNTGTVGASSGAADAIGIEAVTGGDISITTQGSVSGRLYGILTDTTGGTGSTVITVNSGTAGGSFGVAGSAGIEARTGTGSLLIDIVGGGVSGFSGIATYTGGEATINIAEGRSLSGTLNLNPGAGTTTTLSNAGLLGSSGFSGLDSVRLTSEASQGRIVIDNDGRVLGLLDFAANSGGVEFNIDDGGAWRSSAASAFGAGDDALNIASGGLFVAGHKSTGGSGPNADFAIDFGAGANSVSNAGVMLIGSSAEASNSTEGAQDTQHTELSLLNLTSFDNSGTILLGGTAQNSTTGIYAHREGFLPLGDFTGADEALLEASDQWPDDILSMPGVTFTGLDGSRILFDVDLMSQGQDSCDSALRADDGDLVADCVSIVGGATAGTTLVAVHDVYGGDRGIYNPEGTVLIDVSGGTSAAEHFVLDPLSDSYSPAFGGVIDKGALFYALAYDEATQQHKLVGLVSGNAAQFPLLAGAAHSLWRVTTGSWFDRQADLRGGLEDVGGGVWLRINGEFAERDAAYATGAAGATFDFDNSFSQNSYAITGGADVIAGGAGDTAYVLGVMAGYGHSVLDFEASANEAQFDGFTGGLYASLVSGGLFVDAALSANKLDLKNDIPALNLYPAGTVLDTHLLSVGGQVEAGWRMPLGAAFVEPLANLSYVRTTYDELEIPAGDPASPRIGVEYDDPTSLRAGVGARLGLDQDLGSIRAQYSGLVRLWNEFEGETQVTLQNLGADPVLTDDFSGQFTEIGVGASVLGMDGIISGFVNLGGKLGDDYQATTASAGVRVNW